MKIRTGFVSNSSSSSFIILGKPVNFYDINPEHINNIFVEGTDLSDGIDFFQLNLNMYDYLMGNPKFVKRMYFWDVKAKIEDGSMFNRNIITDDGLTITIINQDYHCSTTLQDIENRYDR